MLKKNSNLKRTLAVLLALAMTLAFAGCASSTGSGSDQSSVSDRSALSGEVNGASGSSSAESETADKAQSFQAMLSYVNYNYIETGDESQPKLIRKINAQLTPRANSESSKVEAVVDALASVPESAKGGESVVDGRVDINFVKISGGTAVVDVASSNLDSLSEMDEQFFIYQISDSVLNTFSDIKGVRFTVDGTNTDVLVSMDISQPFDRAAVSEFLNEKADSAEAAEASSSAESGAVSAAGTSDQTQTGVVNDDQTASGSASGSGVVDDDAQQQ